MFVIAPSETFTHALTENGQIMRLENFNARYRGLPSTTKPDTYAKDAPKFRVGTLPHVSNIRPNRYDHRPTGKR